MKRLTAERAAFLACAALDLRDAVRQYLPILRQAVAGLPELAQPEAVEALLELERALMRFNWRLKHGRPRALEAAR